MDDDDALVARIRGGDARAREELARAHLPLLARLVRRYVSAPDAEDVAQRAMVQALERIESFRGESTFRAWLHRIAVNAAISHARRAKREIAAEIDEADLITNTLGTQRLVAREAKQRLLAALRELPEKQRRSVELRLFSEMTFAEVGAELGISEDSAKMNFHHAMKRLRAEIDPDR